MNTGTHPLSTTLTIKISPRLERELNHATQRTHLTKSELVRRAIEAYVSRAEADSGAFVSALDQAGDLVGCFKGGPSDLSSNPRHMDGFRKV